jgi:hypothetical protein
MNGKPLLNGDDFRLALWPATETEKAALEFAPRAIEDGEMLHPDAPEQLNEIFPAKPFTDVTVTFPAPDC